MKFSVCRFSPWQMNGSKWVIVQKIGVVLYTIWFWSSALFSSLHKRMHKIRNYFLLRHFEKIKKDRNMHVKQETSTRDVYYAMSTRWYKVVGFTNAEQKEIIFFPKILLLQRREREWFKIHM